MGPDEPELSRLEFVPFGASVGVPTTSLTVMRADEREGGTNNPTSSCPSASTPAVTGPRAVQLGAPAHVQRGALQVGGGTSDIALAVRSHDGSARRSASRREASAEGGLTMKLWHLLFHSRRITTIYTAAIAVAAAIIQWVHR